MSISIQRLTPTIGAEISGVDLKQPLSPEDKAAILDAFRDYHVLFFRDQMLNAEQHLAFAKTFGEIAPHPYNPTLEGGLDGVQILEAKGNEPRHRFTDQWHTDVTFLEKPYKGAVLGAQIIPSIGGDTMWSNLATAYEMLPDSLQRAVDGMEARHRWPRIEDPDHYKPVVHPVVRVHPETGRKSLMVNSMFTTEILGLSPSESQLMLTMLTDLTKKPETQVRFRWSVGSLAVWDNRCTAHYALLDYTEPRRMHRVTLAGETPIAPHQYDASRKAAA